jgi:hypothetical protein
MALKALNSVAGFSVGETPANIILANGDVSANNFSTTGKSNLNAIANVIITGGTSGQVIQTDGSGNLSFVTLNTAQLANGNSNIQVYANGNIALSSTGNANVFVVTGTGANISGTLSTSGNISALGVLTDNLYYANGSPWDLQEAAGSNTQIQFNNNNNFGASANFTFDSATNVLYVNGTISGTGNANLGNIGTGIITATGTVTGGNLATGGTLSAGGNANVGNLGTTGVFATTLSATGNANVGNLGTTGVFATTLSATGNANVENLGTIGVFATTLSASGNANVGNLGTTTLTATGNANVAGILTDNYYYANGSPVDFQQAAGSNTQIQFNNNNDFGASANFTFDTATNALYVNGTISGTGNANLGNIGTGVVTASGNITGANIATVGALSVGGNANIGNIGTEIITASGNITGSNLNTNGFLSVGGNANIGNIGTGGFITANGTVTGGNLATGGTLSVTGNANIGNVGTGIVTASGNIDGANLNTGGILSVGGNANIGNINTGIILATGNITGNNLTVNLELSGNTANFTGNIVAANFIGSLANGNSEIKVYNNANVEFTIGGSANLVSITTTGIYIDGQIETTAGNILANGNVTANGFLVGANANVTGSATVGSLVTSNITAPSGNITISAAGANENIVLNPTGNGTVDVGLHRITQVGGPTDPLDAATKEYVDSTSQGLTIHTAVRVTSTTNLNATYANGGSVLTTIAISGGKTIQFGTAHGLSIGDELAWDNSFNGIVGNDPYFVYSTPANDTITVKAGYFGAEVTTLTNGTGLSQTARANTGVGATLTNAGANAALSIDSISLASTNRVLVQGQTNQFENGIYTVTTVGDGSTAWVLTRATTEDTYSPISTNALGYGDYFFVQQGINNAGSSYVVTSPVGEILFGLTNIAFSQFSASGSFSAGNGIAITGTVISANVDGITTDIVGGNIVVKSSAQLTTPNIGDATGTSLSVSGNVSANNISVANIANVTGNLTIGGVVQANGNISSNNWVNANDIFATNNISAQGNALIGNISANGLISSNTANVTALITTGNITVNNEFSGNTANFSGNVILPNLTVNLQLSGNTANFTGTANAGNFNTGGLITATGNITGGNLATGGTLSAGGNANVGNLGTGGIITATGNITGGNIISNGESNVATNLNIGNTSVNTTITWASTTTTAVTANQTIASFSVAGVTGVEYLVKAVDATGGKYSIATVQAVTDGANVDFATFGTVQLGGYTGSLAVNISGGFIRLQVTPASSNSTVWTTQYRLI